MHRMWSARRRSAPRLVVGALVGAVGLAGCSGPDSSDDSTPTQSSTPATTLEDGTTAPGTELKLGKTATLRYTAKPKPDSLVEVTVQSVKRGKIKDLEEFDLSGAAKKSSVYYVRTRIKNVGRGDLSGQPLTLYGQVSDDLVVPPVEFGSTFKRCDYDPLPENFKKSEKAKVCLVILAPNKGKIDRVQWRPADDSEPISWLIR